jgi:hypothetical protein
MWLKVSKNHPFLSYMCHSGQPLEPTFKDPHVLPISALCR